MAPLGASLGAASLALLVLASGSGCILAADPTPPDGDRYEGTRVEYQGRLYWIRDGDLYVRGEDGWFHFVEHLYDPDYYERNYVEIDGIVYRVQPDTQELIPTTATFEDGFEGVGAPSELISPLRWHSNNADPLEAGGEFNYFNAGSRIALVQSPVRSAPNALQCHTEPGSDIAKASLATQVVHYRPGDQVHFRLWIHIEESADLLGEITLLDLESSWITQYQGLRVVVVGGALAVELKSFAKRTYRQSAGDELLLPIGEWVEIRGRIRLSFDDAGVVQLWQNGALVIDARGMTLPVPDVILNSLEVGLTSVAPGTATPTTLYVDDLAVSDRYIE